MAKPVEPLVHRHHHYDSVALAAYVISIILMFDSHVPTVVTVGATLMNRWIFLLAWTCLFLLSIKVCRLKYWGIPVAARIVSVESITSMIWDNGYKLTVAYRTDGMPPDQYIVWNECLTWVDPRNKSHPPAVSSTDDDPDCNGSRDHGTIQLTVLPGNPKVAFAESNLRKSRYWGEFMFVLYWVYVLVYVLVSSPKTLSVQMGLSWEASVSILCLEQVSVWIFLAGWWWYRERPSDAWEVEIQTAIPLLVV